MMNKNGKWKMVRGANTYIIVDYNLENCFCQKHSWRNNENFPKLTKEISVSAYRSEQMTSDIYVKKKQTKVLYSNYWN